MLGGKDTSESTDVSSDIPVIQSDNSAEDQTTLPVAEEPQSEETETEETKPAETEPKQVVNTLTLSRETLRLTIGSGSVVYATVQTSDGKGTSVSWSVSDKKVASIAANPGGGIDVKGVAEGECILTCRAGNQIKAECKVIVTTITSVNQNTDNATADFLTNGMFIYGDGVYTPAYYAESSAKFYAQTMAYYKSLFGKDVRVNVVMTPVSSL